MADINITGKRLPLKAESILKDILTSANLNRAEVLSTTRTYREQSHEIINYYKHHGAASAKSLYGHGPGGVAIKIYEAGITSKKGMPAIVNEMTASIRAALRKERRTFGHQKHLMHTSDSHFVFDVNPGSITNKDAFIAAVKKNTSVSRFLYAGSIPSDKSFHIEIPK